MQTKETILKTPPGQGINLPILLAQYHYSKQKDMLFLNDLNHYLFEGYVLSTPSVFVLGKFVVLEEDEALFIRFACGRIAELRKYLPEGVAWIAFCRNNQGNIRKYKLDRLEELGNMGTLTSPLFSNGTLE